jgi:D-alanyl-D-alanine carboxypeptidase
MTIHHTAPASALMTKMNRRTLLLGAGAVGLTASVLPGFASRGARAADLLADQLDAVLAASVAGGLPGVALHIERAGKPLYAGAAGLASIERKTPLKATDRFRIFSLAKSFTAIVALQLVDEGVLALEDPVAKWLDDPAVGRIPNTDRITLRQLLTHRSGVYDYLDETDSPFWTDAFFGPDADWARVWTPQELIAYAGEANHAPYFAPGEGEHYSNTGYVLLGLVVEAATGHPFGEELQNRVLSPLALADTFFVEGATMPEGTIDGYHRLEGELVNVSATNVSWAWAAGGMVSTLADMGRFARAAYGGELLAPDSFAAMFTVPPGGGYAMGLGAGRSPHGEVTGLIGSGGGFTASMYRLPADDLTVVVMLNKAPDEGEIEAIRDEAIGVVLGSA